MGNNQKCALIVGFNWKDEFALQRAWFDSGVTIPIRFVADVIAAAAFMKRRDRWRAGIVLLEWKEQEPRLLQFLHWLRKEPAMREVIVIMCAHDCNDQTVKTAYANGVDCCVQRSDNFGEVVSLLRRVENYWFDPSLFECSRLKSA